MADRVEWPGRNLAFAVDPDASKREDSYRHAFGKFFQENLKQQRRGT